MLYPLLISVSGCTCIFCLLSALSSLTHRKAESIHKRISEINAEQSAETLPKKEKRIRMKKRSSALAKTKKQLEKLENELYDSGVHIPVETFLFIWLALTIFIPILFSVLGLDTILVIVIAGICAGAPIFLLKNRKKTRCKQLDDQLVDAISILINAIRAGHSFQSAMQHISKEMTGVVSEEFGRVFRETQHGMTLDESMKRMVERTGSEDLDILCTAVLIQREVGGNLAEVLENISGTIQARLALKAEIKTRTASGRLSAYLIGGLPLILLLAISVINPGYADKLFHTSTGNVMLIVGAVMEVIGFIVIMKMTDIKY